MKVIFFFFAFDAKAIEVNTNRWDYIKLKSLHKQTINKMKREPFHYNLFLVYTNHISDKSLISKIYKDFYNLIGTRQITILNGPGNWIDISLKNTYEWMMCIRKGAQNYYQRQIRSTMLLPHTCRNGYYEKSYKIQLYKCTRMWRNLNPYTFLVGVWSGAASI